MKQFVVLLRRIDVYEQRVTIPAANAGAAQELLQLCLETDGWDATTDGQDGEFCESTSEVVWAVEQPAGQVMNDE